MWIFQAEIGRFSTVRPARIAPHIFGGSKSSFLCPDETFHIPMGEVSILCAALRAGAHYMVASGQFTWLSRDGLCSGFNASDFEGADLQTTGQKGTRVAIIKNTDPLPTNIFVKDDDR